MLTPLTVWNCGDPTAKLVLWGADLIKTFGGREKSGWFPCEPLDLGAMTQVVIRRPHKRGGSVSNLTPLAGRNLLFAPKELWRHAHTAAPKTGVESHTPRRKEVAREKVWKKCDRRCVPRKSDVKATKLSGELRIKGD